MIPKVIHQIWIQGYHNLPDKYIKYHNQCKQINNNFLFIVWDDNMIRELISNYDKKYLDLYDNYKSNAQKADLARYLIIYKYGGIYLDMDTWCIKNLKDFLKYKFFCTDVGKYIKHNNNNIFGAVPNHVLLKNILKELYKRKKCSYNILYSTGPYLFTFCINKYKKNNNDITLISQKYLYPCSTLFKKLEDINLSKYKDTYIIHDTTVSWSPPLKYFFDNWKYIIIIIIIIVILIFIVLFFFNQLF